jgi:hypothetical protein
MSYHQAVHERRAIRRIFEGENARYGKIMKRFFYY